ncbi:hypothetical protein [Thermosynechococcus sp. FA-CM-4201]
MTVRFRTQDGFYGGDRRPLNVGADFAMSVAIGAEISDILLH